MPPAQPPQPQPAVVKAVALIGWYVLILLLVVRGEITWDKAFVAAGAPLGLVMGFRVGDWLRALLIKR